MDTGLSLPQHSAVARPPSPATPLALYVHLPFCRTRCVYCAFNTYAGLNALVEPYTQALIREIELVAASGAPYRVQTLYFGGGTPSQLPPSSVAAIIHAVKIHFTHAEDWEVSFEMNPGDAEADYLARLRQAGVNRLSIGMQSAIEEELRFFGRRHTHQDVEIGVAQARRAGIENISLDLIYGLPEQPMVRWQKSVEAALDYDPAHLSLYSLSVEDGTPLHRRITTGQCPPPDPDRAADMYEWAAARLERAGYRHYEISNWARPGFECRHNLYVWHNLPYLGFGAGAHGYAAHTRTKNFDWPPAYIDRLRAQPAPMPFPLTAATETAQRIMPDEEMAETVILGLRLTEDGLSEQIFRRRFGRRLTDVFGPQLQHLIALRLLERMPEGRYRLTPRGRLLGNHVFAAFV